jgi:CRISPR-associated protein Cas5d
MSPPTVSVKVWGEYALFSRPELSVERISYPMITPSAARGVLDAILYRPQMSWHVRRISVLKPTLPSGFPKAEGGRPFRLVGIRRNEIQGKIALRTVEGWISAPETFVPYMVDSAGREGVQGQNRTQRNSLVLQHVAYRIDASPRLTAKANQPRRRPETEEEHGPDTVAKYVAMFQRRVAKGQCFHRPYLGIREFACDFSPAGDEPAIPWTESLGFMLYDIRFTETEPGVFKPDRPGFFDAKVKDGVLHCDTESRGPNGESPIVVHGWSNEEVLV